MSKQYPPASTAKVYYDSEGNERTLCQMIKLEPEWARSRIIAGEIAKQQLSELQAMYDGLLELLTESVCALEVCGKDFRVTEVAREAIAKHRGQV